MKLLKNLMMVKMWYENLFLYNLCVLGYKVHCTTSLFSVIEIPGHRDTGVTEFKDDTYIGDMTATLT